MNGAARSIRAAVAVAAFVACLGASPGPRGPQPKSEYEAPERPALAREDRQRLSTLTRMSLNERISQERELAVERLEALEKVTDRSLRLAELDVWMRRTHGRFRVEGTVEARVPSRVPGVVLTRTGKIVGVADCAGIGEGPGVQCILNATWPVIDSFGGPVRSPTDALRTFNPALLVFGIDPKLLEVRAMLVTDDTMTHTWAGLLEESTLTARRIIGCRELSGNGIPDLRCISELQVTAEPDSEVVSLQFRAGATFRFAMHRDADARPEKPMKTRKGR